MTDQFDNNALRLHLLGTGTPVLDLLRQATTAILLEIGSTKILFDAGRGATTQLLKQNIHPAAIDILFITHHHYDHIGNLGEFLLSAWHNGRVEPLPIFGPPGTSAIVEALFQQVYARDIMFTLFNEPESVDIRELVKVTDVLPGRVYNGSTWRIEAEYVNHGHSLGLTEIDWPCLGYRLTTEDKIIAIGGDTAVCEGLNRLAVGADTLVLACYLAEKEITTPQARRLADHIILSSGQAGKVAAQAGVKRLVLTHFRKKSAALMQSIVDDVKLDYQGELFLAEDGMIIDL
jgi:ribonuclease Z